MDTDGRTDGQGQNKMPPDYHHGDIKMKNYNSMFYLKTVGVIRCMLEERVDRI